MTSKEKLESWLLCMRIQYQMSGRLMFMGLPDEWYEPVTYACENGHISHRYLKSEAIGKNVCLGCMKDIYLCPNISEIELNEILK